MFVQRTEPGRTAHLEFIALAIIASALTSFWLKQSRLPGFELFPTNTAQARAMELSGVVRAEPQATLVEASEGGQMLSIEVREGQKVEAGDLLARLDPKDALVEAENLHLQLALNFVSRAAINAEQDSSSTLALGESELQELSEAPAAAAAVRDLLRAQEAALSERAEIERMRRGVQSRQMERLEKKQQVLKTVQERTSQQLASVNAERARIADMVKRGTFPVNRSADVDRQAMALEIKIAETDAMLGETASEIENLQIAGKELARTRWEELFAKEQDITVRISDLRQKIDVNRRHIARAELRAPHAGIVRNLRSSSPGSPTEPGEILMEVTKADETFLVEVTAPESDVSALVPGQGAHVRIAGSAGLPEGAAVRAVVDGTAEDGSATEPVPPGSKAQQTRSVFLTIAEADVPAALRRKLRTGANVPVYLPKTLALTARPPAHGRARSPSDDTSVPRTPTGAS